MEGFLVCSVCVEEFSNDRVPLILMCGHTFCSVCLRNIQECTGELACPIDRVVDWRDFREVKKNMAISQIVEYKTGKLIRKCNVHEIKKIKFLCFDCQDFYCSRCLDCHIHHNWKQFSSAKDFREYFNDRKMFLKDVKIEIEARFEVFLAIETGILEKYQKIVEQVDKEYRVKEEILKGEKEVVIWNVIKEGNSDLNSCKTVKDKLKDSLSRINSLLLIENADIEQIFVFEKSCLELTDLLKSVEKLVR